MPRRRENVYLIELVSLYCKLPDRHWFAVTRGHSVSDVVRRLELRWASPDENYFIVGDYIGVLHETTEGVPADVCDIDDAEEFNQVLNQLVEIP